MYFTFIQATDGMFFFQILQSVVSEPLSFMKRMVFLAQKLLLMVTQL